MQILYNYQSKIHLLINCKIVNYVKWKSRPAMTKHAACSCLHLVLGGLQCTTTYYNFLLIVERAGNFSFFSFSISEYTS